MKPIVPFLALSALLAGHTLAGGGAAPVTRPSADLIVTNAKVTTVDPARPNATAFAVKDGKFQAIGGAEILNQYRGP